MFFKSSLLLISVLLVGCVLPPKESEHPAALENTRVGLQGAAVETPEETEVEAAVVAAAVWSSETVLRELVGARVAAVAPGAVRPRAGIIPRAPMTPTA